MRRMRLRPCRTAAPPPCGLTTSTVVAQGQLTIPRGSADQLKDSLSMWLPSVLTAVAARLLPEDCSASFQCKRPSPQTRPDLLLYVVGATGFEPVTSSVSAIPAPPPCRPAVSLPALLRESQSYVLSATRVPGRLSRSFVRGALHLDSRASVPTCTTIPRASMLASRPGEEGSSPGAPSSCGDGRIATRVYRGDRWNVTGGLGLLSRTARHVWVCDDPFVATR